MDHLSETPTYPDRLRPDTVADVLEVSPDRAGFVTSLYELDNHIEQLELELVSDDQDALATLRVPLSLAQRLHNAGRELDIETLYKVAAERWKTGRDTRRAIRKTKQDIRAQLQTEAWGLVFNDTKKYAYNPFTMNPTEQFVIGANVEDPVTVYNFGQQLDPDEIEQLASVIDRYSQLTGGYIRQLVPYIVIHDAMLPQYIDRYEKVMEIAGRSGGRHPYIELNRSKLNGRRGSVEQTWLERLVVHELTHNADAFLEVPGGVFTEYFEYIDNTGDGKIDQIIPKADLSSIYKAHILQDSAPPRDYGFINAGEDIAVTSEEGAFVGELDINQPGKYLPSALDPIRRDRYLEFLQRFRLKFENQLAGQLGPDHPDYNRLSSPVLDHHPIVSPIHGWKELVVQQKTGIDITYPSIAALNQPLKVHVDVPTDLLALILNHW